jgi:hypothetical protein
VIAADETRLDAVVGSVKQRAHSRVLTVAGRAKTEPEMVTSAAPVASISLRFMWGPLPIAVLT